MEFKVGDKVIVTNNEPNVNYINIGSIATIIEIDNSSVPYKVLEEGKSSSVWLKNVKHISSNSIPNINMTKKIINVLVVDKETGVVEKNATVVADNEQHAILKAFGVDAEKVYIKTTEQGSYEEEKKLTAVIEK